ncbi:MAG: YIP1 family protein [Dehalococcoidia bacterium]|nr:YIP1 family protein [Dehalococcoidia bacterium]
MIQRMMGAAMFNADTYEEIEADPGAIGQAILVVILVTLCGMVGGLIGGLLGGAGLMAIVLGLVAGLVFGILRWAIWVSVISLVGGMMLRTSNTQTSWAEIGRVVGFAYTPGVLSVFAFVPFIGNLFPIVAFVWTAAAVTLAVRQALDFESTGRAIAVVLISAVIAFIPWLIVKGVEWALLGGGGEATSGALSLIGLV